MDYLDKQQYSYSISRKLDQDELIINQTICSSFSDFCTNFSSDSNINEHKYINNNFICFDTLIEHVGENDMNLSQSTKCCSQKEINLFQANVDKSFDEGLSADLDLESVSFEMLKVASPHYI